MQIKNHHFVVHKFGGASVKNSEAVRNVGDPIELKISKDPLSSSFLRWERQRMNWRMCMGF